MTNQTIENISVLPFVQYCWSFYNPEDGIYPIKGLTVQMLVSGCRARMDCPAFCNGDSIDREWVRDYVLASFDLKWCD